MEDETWEAVWVPNPEGGSQEPPRRYSYVAPAVAAVEEEARCEAEVEEAYCYHEEVAEDRQSWQTSSSLFPRILPIHR